MVNLLEGGSHAALVTHWNAGSWKPLRDQEQQEPRRGGVHVVTVTLDRKCLFSKEIKKKFKRIIKMHHRINLILRFTGGKGRKCRFAQCCPLGIRTCLCGHWSVRLFHQVHPPLSPRVWPFDNTGHVSGGVGTVDPRCSLSALWDTLTGLPENALWWGVVSPVLFVPSSRGSDV